MMSKVALKDAWEKLTPGAKKAVVIGGGLLVMILFCYVLVVATGGGGKKTKGNGAAAAKIENALLPGGDAAKQMGLASLPREVDRNKVETSRLAEEVAKLRGSVESQAQGESGAAQAQEATKALQSDVQQLRAVLEKVVEAQKQEELAGKRALANGAALAPGTGVAMPMQQQAPQGFAGIRTIGGEGRTSGVQPAGGLKASGGVSAPNSSGSVEAPERSAPAGQVGRDAETYTPSGSMIQGVLLTGLDAPTGQNAMKEPTPALIRVKKESILPNRFLADFRECFIIVGGHGDLASERAMLRAENLSCIRNDKSVIDAKLEGWVVGNDGKAGVRGRLVSKQGAVLARASLAGLADGISQAFSGNVRGQLPGTGMDSDYTLQSGAFGGASTAMDRIAKYYLDLADQMHPVVEVDAGREVTLVLVRGITLPALRPRSQQTK
jgi:conjugal transfer pilus assembly protein TraB